MLIVEMLVEEEWNDCSGSLQLASSWFLRNLLAEFVWKWLIGAIVVNGLFSCGSRLQLQEPFPLQPHSVCAPVPPWEQTASPNSGITRRAERCWAGLCWDGLVEMSFRLENTRGLVLGTDRKQLAQHQTRERSHTTKERNYAEIFFTPKFILVGLCAERWSHACAARPTGSVCRLQHSWKNI